MGTEETTYNRFILPSTDPKGVRFTHENSLGKLEIDRTKATIYIQLKDQSVFSEDGLPSDFIQKLFYEYDYLSYFVPTVQISIEGQMRSIRVCVIEFEIDEICIPFLFVLPEPFNPRGTKKSVFYGIDKSQYLFEDIPIQISEILKKLLYIYFNSCNPADRHSSSVDLPRSQHVRVNVGVLKREELEKFWNITNQMTSIVANPLFKVSQDPEDDSLVFSLYSPFTMF